MSPPFSLKSGIVPGRSHILYRKNCQDAVRSSSFIKNDSEYYLGFVCDGCSSGKFSEIGANLGATFLLHRAEILVQAGVPLSIIPTFLYQNILEYLQKPIFGNNPEERSRFIQDYLLFTIVGFLSGPLETVLLTAGDGLTVINDDIVKIDCNNEPEYLAYNLVDRTHLQPGFRDLSSEFNFTIVDTQDICRLAIGSDGWFDNPELINEVWEKSHPMSLQRQMNVWSEKDHLFSDDASLITLEQKS